MKTTGLASSLLQLGRETAQIVLPSGCVVCQRELPWQARRASCCLPCWSSLPAIRGPKCLRCSTPFASRDLEGATLCISCREKSWSCEWIDAWGLYSGALERVLHAFKFDRHDFLGGPLSELLLERLGARSQTFDAVVPVPMHRSKSRRRGYNQAEILSKGLSRLSKIPHRTDLLLKTAAGVSQSTLPRSERRANVRGTFHAPGDAGGMSVLLIDDICTTGETLEACARALRGSGATRVCALVVARA